MAVVVGIRCRGELLEFGVVLLLLVRGGGGNHGRCAFCLLSIHRRGAGRSTPRMTIKQ